MIRRLRHPTCACGVPLGGISGRLCAVFLVIFLLGITASAGSAATPPRMRPYSGIGLVVFSNTGVQDIHLQMYEEPGILRVGVLDGSGITGNEWIFGASEEALPLIVSARKGNWLRIFFDDAGREAWIDPQNKGRFQSWEQYLKKQTGRVLPALQPQYYQLVEQPGGKLLGVMTPKQVFKVLKLDNSWVMVLTDMSQIGWVRWRDDDGRLTVGTGNK